MSDIAIILATIVGIVVLVTGVLAVVFGLIRRRLAAEAAKLSDVQLDDGTVTMTTRYDTFRSATMARSGFRRNLARIVLTRTHLHLLERPQRYGVFTRTELGCYSVGTTDGSLHLWSSHPPRATGTIDYRIPVSDPDRWVAALVEAGAQRADA